jgi:hypothetical protein
MTTEIKSTRGNPMWKKGGPSPNPAGRPWEARNKLHSSVVDAVVELWDEGGKESLRTVMLEDPATYHRLTFGLLPKEHKLEAKVEEVRQPGKPTAEDYRLMMLICDAVRAAGANKGVELEVVKEWITEDLRARMATHVPAIEAPPEL